MYSSTLKDPCFPVSRGLMPKAVQVGLDQANGADSGGPKGSQSTLYFRSGRRVWPWLNSLCRAAGTVMITDAPGFGSCGPLHTQSYGYMDGIGKSVQSCWFSLLHLPEQPWKTSEVGFSRDSCSKNTDWNLVFWCPVNLFAYQWGTWSRNLSRFP